MGMWMWVYMQRGVCVCVCARLCVCVCVYHLFFVYVCANTYMHVLHLQVYIYIHTLVYSCVDVHTCTSRDPCFKCVYASYLRGTSFHVGSVSHVAYVRQESLFKGPGTQIQSIYSGIIWVPPAYRSIPQLPLKVPKIPSHRDQKGLDRGTLECPQFPVISFL